MLLFCANALGELLVTVAEYDFAEGSRASVDMSASSAASTIADGKGFSSKCLDSAGVPAPCLYVDGKQTENTAEESLKSGDYWTFTVTPLVGELAYQRLTFHAQAAAHPKYSGHMQLNFAIYTSLDNYAKPIKIHSERAEELKVSNFKDLHQVDLSSLPGSSSPVTFRMVVWDSSKAEVKQNRIDNIRLTAIDRSSLPLIEGIRYSYPEGSGQPNHPDAADAEKGVLTDRRSDPGGWNKGGWAAALRKGGSPLRIRFDLGSVRSVRRIVVDCMDNWPAGISAPTEIQLRFSEPGKDLPPPVSITGIPSAAKWGRRRLVIHVADVTARFVDIKLLNRTGGWTFLSEVAFYETPVGKFTVVGSGLKEGAGGPVAWLHGPKDPGEALVPQPVLPKASKPAPKPVATSKPQPPKAQPPAKHAPAAVAPKPPPPGPVKAKVTASSTREGSSPKLAMDGNNNTYWSSAKGPSIKSAQWIQVSFSRSVTLKGFSIRGGAHHSPGRSAMQISDDGKKYATLKSKVLKNGELWREVFFPVSTRFVRFRFVSAYSQNKETQSAPDVRISEIKLSGAKSPQAGGGR